MNNNLDLLRCNKQMCCLKRPKRIRELTKATRIKDHTTREEEAIYCSQRDRNKRWGECVCVYAVQRFIGRCRCLRTSCAFLFVHTYIYTVRCTKLHVRLVFPLVVSGCKPLTTVSVVSPPSCGCIVTSSSVDTRAYQYAPMAIPCKTRKYSFVLRTTERTA